MEWDDAWNEDIINATLMMRGFPLEMET